MQRLDYRNGSGSKAGRVTPDNFKFLAQFLKKESGLVITEEKAYLVESRLASVVRKLGAADLDELILAVRGAHDPNLNNDVVEAMATTDSFFFRDIRPFVILKNAVLPRIVPAREAANAKRIRIWSAGCSSGQEPYSIAMILKQNSALLHGLDLEIIGTDLSSEVLGKAREGIYTQFEAQRGLPIRLLVKYFTQVGEHWQINEEIRGAVEFHRANLMGDLQGLGQFDIVFCRNVLTYFDSATKSAVLGRIRSMMADDGWLFVGAGETIDDLEDSFTAVEGQRGVYAVDRAHAAAVPHAPQPMAKSA